MLNQMVKQFQEASNYFVEIGVIEFYSFGLQMSFKNLLKLAQENNLTLNYQELDGFAYPFKAQIKLGDLTFFALVSKETAKELNLLPKYCPICGQKKETAEAVAK